MLARALIVVIAGFPILSLGAARPAQPPEHLRTVTTAPPTAPSSATVDSLEQRFGPSRPTGRVIVVSIADQRLYLYDDRDLAGYWPVSTSKFGVGNQEGSNRTPLGAHKIARKIGVGAAPGALFRGRENTGRIVEILRDDRAAPDDFITTRILWLTGLEPGINSGGNVDSFERYIYIHGTAEEGRIGRPASHGCVRMRNADVMELFELVEEGTLVVIVP